MALIKLIWLDEPREVAGLGLVLPHQEISVRENLANQLIRQGFARAKKKSRRKQK